MIPRLLPYLATRLAWAVLGAVVYAVLVAHPASSTSRPSEAAIPAGVSSVSPSGNLPPRTGAPYWTEQAWSSVVAAEREIGPAEGTSVAVKPFGAPHHTTAAPKGQGLGQAEAAVAFPSPSAASRKEVRTAGTTRSSVPASSPAAAASRSTVAGVFHGLHPIAESWYRGTAAGLASWMPESYGAGYAALPVGPGFVFRACGAAGCVVMTSNDAGPDLSMQRKGRVADLAVAVWERITGLPRGLGLAQITVTLMGRVH